jgi:hypothetical protein
MEEGRRILTGSRFVLNELPAAPGRYGSLATVNALISPLRVRDACPLFVFVPAKRVA